MNDLNFLIIIGIVILIIAIFSLIIYLIQKKLFDIIKSNIHGFILGIFCKPIR